MSAKKLASEEMLQVTADWLNPQSPAHKAILASEDLAPSLPRITAVHENLSKNAQPIVENPRIDQISKEQALIDTRHDDIIRGSYSILTGIAALLGAELGASILELRDNLIPDGLSSTQKSYLAEAGQAAQLSERLTPEVRAVTNKIRIDPKHATHTLTDCLNEWIHLGQQLGSLENEKAQLAPADRTQATLLAARNKWIRMVNLFLATAEAAEIDPATYQLIFGPLLAAQAKAAKRGSKPASAPETPAEPLVKPTSE
jgi:hypothetical protein